MICGLGLTWIATLLVALTFLCAAGKLEGALSWPWIQVVTPLLIAAGVGTIAGLQLFLSTRSPTPAAITMVGLMLTGLVTGLVLTGL